MEETLPFETLYPHLFTPLTIRGKTLKNRIIAGPQGLSSLVTPEGFNNREASVFFGGKSRGGAAVVTLSEPVISKESGCGHNAQINLCDELTLRELNQLSDFVHTYGGLLSAEITHCGQWAMPACNGERDPIGPTARVLPNGVCVKEMTEEDMDYVAQCYADACVMARRGGADMANIHGGHGWLLHQFLSPLENQRTDSYGGSLENRARFPMLVLDRIRAAVGNDFLLEYRVSANELSAGGMRAEETAEFICLIQDKIDLVQCSVGTRRNAVARGAMHPGRYLPQGCNVYAAEAMKRAGVKIPVVTVGGIDDPALADRIIAEGKADMVALVRALIADPDWGEKARTGRAEDIRPCIKCMRCLDAGAGRSNTSAVVSQAGSKGTKHIECSVNPFHGRAWMAPYFPLRAGRKRVVVVGGGPAGLEAALRAAALGWEVILFEQSSRLGGLLNLAEGIDFKEDLFRYRDYLVHQVEKAAIAVHLNMPATPALVRGLGADAVIVAVGASPLRPNISGLDRQNVMTPAQLHVYPDRVGPTVAVIGGGLIGCETALELLEQEKNVFVLEMGPVLAPDAIFTDRLLTMHFLEHGYQRETAALLPEGVNPRFMPCVNTRCIGVVPGGVQVVDQAGEERLIPADTVVLAAGMVPRADLRDSFRGTAFDVISVGDCVKASHVQHAVRTACDAVLALSTRNI